MCVLFINLEKIFNAIQRFKDYSIFLCDDALAKLTTSLISLSTHVIAITTAAQNATAQYPSIAPATSEKAVKLPGPLQSVSVVAKDVVQRIANAQDVVGGAVRQIQQMQPQQSNAAPELAGRSTASTSGSVVHYWSNAPVYMADQLTSGLVSYSLYSAIEIVKVNSFRLSRVWQMVTSHLRTIASNKVRKIYEISYPCIVQINILFNVFVFYSFIYIQWYFL